MARSKSGLDTRSIGLDVGVAFMRWLTGAENLHYGLWTGLDVNAGNLGAAQAAYTERLFGHLPEARLRVLDIGGGAGETARRLAAAGHEVEIVVPSGFLAERCRANAPSARVHETRFETFEAGGRFDQCLFSESFQYIPAAVALDRAIALLKPGGEILIADCFRSANYEGVQRSQTVGGGHRLAAVRALFDERPLELMAEDDITESVAPSVEVEQAMFNLFGHAVRRVDAELARVRPRQRWLLHRVLRLGLGERRRFRLGQRLFETRRTAEAFCHYNRYMIFRLGLRPPT